MTPEDAPGRRRPRDPARLRDEEARHRRHQRTRRRLRHHDDAADGYPPRVHRRAHGLRLRAARRGAGGVQHVVPAAPGRNQPRARSGSTPGACSPAEEALAAGLVSRVVPPEALLPAARELALEIAQNTSAVSVALIRQMLWRMLGADHPMEAHRIDSLGMACTGRSPDAYEGITSFLEKRPPRFTQTPGKDMPPFYPMVAATPLLSVLDQSPIPSGSTPAEAVHETLELARAADRSAITATGSPSTTRAAGWPAPRPRSSSARWPRRRPASAWARAASCSRTTARSRWPRTSACWRRSSPARIDLGIGRAPGSDGRTARALKHGPGALPLEQFPEQVADVIGFLHDTLRARPSLSRHQGDAHRTDGAARCGCSAPAATARRSPRTSAPHSPSRTSSTPRAARRSRAPTGGLPALAAPAGPARAWRSSSSARRPRPRRPARRSRDLFIVRLYTGRLGPYPSVEEAEALPYTEPERHRARSARPQHRG